MSAWRESGRDMREHPQHDTPRAFAVLALQAMQAAHRPDAAQAKPRRYPLLGVRVETQGGA